MLVTELGLYEVGMDAKDMTDLMAVIRNSCDSAEQEELERESKKVPTPVTITKNKHNSLLSGVIVNKHN